MTQLLSYILIKNLWKQIQIEYELITSSPTYIIASSIAIHVLFVPRCEEKLKLAVLCIFLISLYSAAMLEGDVALQFIKLCRHGIEYFTSLGQDHRTVLEIGWQITPTFTSSR